MKGEGTGVEATFGVPRRGVGAFAKLSGISFQFDMFEALEGGGSAGDWFDALGGGGTALGWKPPY